MEVTLTIPDAIAEQLVSSGQSPARAALEALAVEGYRTHRLTEFQIRQMLGFATRMDVHGFLKQHEAYLHYSLADMDSDDATARRTRRVDGADGERSSAAA